MKLHHVQARLDKRGTIRCQDTCPGWVVRTKPGRPRLMACAACNVLHPPRLQVTDKMVRLLPAACEALIAARQARVERATTRHLVSHTNYCATLCGRTLGMTPNGRRRHVACAITAAITCQECIRLAAMTQAERDAEKQAASAALRDRFAGKREQAERERRERNAATAAAIEAARDDAMVAIDVMEEVGWDRVMLLATACKSVMATAGERAEGRASLVENALRMAVVAHRHANPKSRGERRWLFRVGRRALGVSNVACRFCGHVLLHEQTIGEDYTVATDYHTVRCALKYLSEEMPRTLDDE